MHGKGLRWVLGMAVALAWLAGGRASAGWELPSVISSNMVLQQEAKAPVWGWDEPGTTVTVAFRGRTFTTTCAADGRWEVQVATGKAGGPFDLRIQGTREVVIGGVLVGEVWVAGGQSNMWWHEGNCRDAARERVQADFPGLRMWDANTSGNQGGWPAPVPQRTVKATWVAATPDTVAEFPGVPFFFARELHKHLNVPVGIVHLAVPGQAIETFLSPAYLSANWPGLSIPTNRPQPSCFFHGMVAPVVPYAARGFLWWQGEANADQYARYRVMFPGLIEDWRQCWRAPGAPFLFVELANFLKPQARPVEDDLWPALRDAQVSALNLDRVWEVSAIDVLGPDENPMNIHPANKQLIGHRLFLAALANVYGEPRTVWSGPRCGSARFEGSRAIVTFDHAGGGLVARDGGDIRGFALAGADRQFVWAEARVRGKTIILSSPHVAAPVAVRYSWANNPIGNLGNKEGLPAPAFRTDHWNLTAH